MTEFPISATLVIKGLIRPALLMTHLRVNTYFYGKKHISSGLYIITKQEDRIDGSGYRTILSLTRIAGADEYIERKNYLVTDTVVVGIEKEGHSSHISSSGKLHGGSGGEFEISNNTINEPVNEYRVPAGCLKYAVYGKEGTNLENQVFTKLSEYPFTGEFNVNTLTVKPFVFTVASDNNDNFVYFSNETIGKECKWLNQHQNTNTYTWLMV